VFECFDLMLRASNQIELHVKDVNRIERDECYGKIYFNVSDVEAVCFLVSFSDLCFSFRLNQFLLHLFCCLFILFCCRSFDRNAKLRRMVPLQWVGRFARRVNTSTRPPLAWKSGWLAMPSNLAGRCFFFFLT
jgi:hypothetical protein